MQKSTLALGLSLLLPGSALAVPDQDSESFVNISAAAFTGGDSLDASPMFGAGIGFRSPSFDPYGWQFVYENYLVNDLVHLLVFDAERTDLNEGLYVQHGFIGNVSLGMNVFVADNLSVNVGVSHSDYQLGGDRAALGYNSRWYFATGPAVSVNLDFTSSLLFLSGQFNTPYYHSEGLESNNEFVSVGFFSEPAFIELSAIYRFGWMSVDYASILHDGFARHQVRAGLWFDFL